MNEPFDPIDVRQARQGKPVLAILAISLALTIVVGWVLWGVVGAKSATGDLEIHAIITADPTDGAPPQAKLSVDTPTTIETGV